MAIHPQSSAITYQHTRGHNADPFWPLGTFLSPSLLTPTRCPWQLWLLGEGGMTRPHWSFAEVRWDSNLPAKKKNMRVGDCHFSHLQWFIHTSDGKSSLQMQTLTCGLYSPVLPFASRSTIYSKADTYFNEVVWIPPLTSQWWQALFFTQPRGEIYARHSNILREEKRIYQPP